MKKSLLVAAALAGAVLLPAASANASERAVATSNVNLRAGPSTDYPVVDVLVAGENLRVFGCLNTRSWCDVRFRGQRGWISANYIALTGGNYAGRQNFDPYSAPVVTFSVDGYWGDHYRKRNFYRDRDRFHRGRGPGRDRGDRGPDRRPDRDRGPGRDFGDRGPDRDRGDRGPDRNFGDRGPDRGPDFRDRGPDRDRGDRGGRNADRRDGPDRGDFDRRGRDNNDRGDRGPRRRLDDGAGNDGPPVPLYKVR